MAKAQGNMTGAVEALNKYLETYALPIHFVPCLSFAHCYVHWSMFTILVTLDLSHLAVAKNIEILMMRIVSRHLYYK